MKKPYLMNITEKVTKQVIVWAENRDEAIEITEELCNADEINMDIGTSNDASFSRDVSVQFKAEGYDLGIFEQYNVGAPKTHKVNFVEDDYGNYRCDNMLISDPYGYW